MGPFVRIGMRYVSGLLVAKGVFGSEDAQLLHDPELEAAISTGLGLLMSGVTEYYYSLAKRFGWDK